MRTVLIVGWIGYDQYRKITNEYPDSLFVRENDIIHDGASALVALVRMFDEVVFAQNCSERVAYEVACVMNGTKFSEINKYLTKEGENNESV